MGDEELQPGQEPLTAEEKERFLARAACRRADADVGGDVRNLWPTARSCRTHARVQLL